MACAGDVGVGDSGAPGAFARARCGRGQRRSGFDGAGLRRGGDLHTGPRSKPALHQKYRGRADDDATEGMRKAGPQQRA